MTNQSSWFIKYQSYPRGTVVVQFNPYLGDKRVHTFPRGTRSKVNLIAPVELELVYYDVAV